MIATRYITMSTNLTEITNNLTANGTVRNENIQLCLMEHPVCSLRYSSLLAMILVSVLFVIIIVWTLFGNLLVLAALWKFKGLRSMSNCLIGNLAISDLLLAVTILPISSGNDLLGYWIFGRTMCSIWLVCDVLYCTASIWGLCMIAIDRYTATVHPVWYHEQRTLKWAIIYIIAAWVISIIISIAPFIGWQDMITNFYQYQSTLGKYECLLFMTKSYVLYSAMGSFVIPSILMVFLYVRIFNVLHKRSRTMQKKLSLHSHFETSSQNGSIISHDKGSEESEKLCLHRNETCPTMLTQCDDFPDPETMKGKQRYETRIGSSDSTTESIFTFRESQDVKASSEPAIALSGENHTEHDPPAKSKTFTTDIKRPWKLDRDKELFCKHGSFQVKHKKRFNRRCKSAIEHTQSRKNSKRNTGRKSRIFSYSWGTPSKKPLDKKRDSVSSAKRKFELREQEATKRMALIIICFVVCWIPFLFMYTIRSFCDYCQINVHLTAAIIWLGYINSGVNPVLYTLFNADFRKAFQKLLRFKHEKSKFSRK